MTLKNLTIFAIAVFVVSCHYKKGNFSVTSPSGWLTIDTIKENHRKYVKMYAPVRSSVPIFVENINIGIMRSSNIDRYIKSVIAGIKEKAIYYEEKGKGSIKVNKYDAKWEQHLVQTDKTSDLSEQRVYFIEDQGNIYQIVCSSKANEIQKLEPEIEEVLKSFRIL
jgi:hypothetical protein